MNRDSVRHTVAVTLTLAVVCSLLVSLAAVGLRNLQESNKERSQRKKASLPHSIALRARLIALEVKW